MGLYQSFQQTFVTNVPALLAQGQTVDNLAVGQIGVLDAKTNTGVTSPTYAKNKALYVVHGTPDIDLGLYGGQPNENEYSKLIKGKLIRKFRSAKAQKPQTPLYTVGWSGDVADTNTLFANVGESKNLFLRFTGRIIDRNYSTQGLMRLFKTEPDCVGACDDTCVPLTGEQKIRMVKDLVKQMSADKEASKYAKFKALISCDPALSVTEGTAYKFKVSVCDTGDASALGIVQAQDPADQVKFISRSGSFTTYGVTRATNTTPTALSFTGIFVPDCPTCPSDYTLLAAAKVFQITTPNGVTAANVNTAMNGEITTTQISAGPQFNVYKVTFAPTVSDAAVIADAEAAGYVAVSLGIQSAICTQTTPSSVAWAADGTLKNRTKTYRITIADSVCGTNRLADLQAAYPQLVVSVVNTAGSCVHTYETTVTSNNYEVGCAISEIKFKAPTTFEGITWDEVVSTEGTGADCKVGIQIETAFFYRGTNDCTYDAFPYENDVVQVLASNHNPDWSKDVCEKEWVFRQIRAVRYPQGHGAWVQRMEQESLRYARIHRNFNPVVREIQGFAFQAIAEKYYDQYTLEFEVKFKTSGGWSEEYNETYHLNIFVPEGQGDAIEQTFNSYVTSAGIEENGTQL